MRSHVIVWGNSSTNTVDIWQSFLARVATYAKSSRARRASDRDHRQGARLRRQVATDQRAVIAKIDDGSSVYGLLAGRHWRVQRREQRAHHIDVYHLRVNGSSKTSNGSRAIGGDADTTSLGDDMAYRDRLDATRLRRCPVSISHNGASLPAKAKKAIRLDAGASWVTHGLMFVGTSCQFCANTTTSRRS